MGRKITVNGNKIDWFEGMTIHTVLKKMNYTFRMLVVSVNGVLVKKEQYGSFQVPDGAEVKVLHMIAGG